MWRVCPVLVANACPRVPAEGAGPQRRLAAGHLQLLGEVSAARVAGGGAFTRGCSPELRPSVSLQVSCRQEKEARAQRASGKAHSCLEQQ